jgi:[acyl-carrier-protein] S-malonyltransferase
MSAARDALRSAIASAAPREADIPVVSNVDASPHHCGDDWAGLLSAQLSSPVRWKQSLLTLVGLGVTEFVELGPGGVLTGMAKRTATQARTISVATPEDLDKLIEFLRIDLPTKPTGIEGEHLFASERFVVSPAAGVFAKAPGIADGASVDIGMVLGHVGEHEVISPFAGVLQSYMVLDTERLIARQPVAWLRTL